MFVCGCSKYVQAIIETRDENDGTFFLVSKTKNVNHARIKYANEHENNSAAKPPKKSVTREPDIQNTRWE